MFGYDPDDYAPMATMSDAHAEWHRNTGVPMGQPGCPQDACHPYDDEPTSTEADLEMTSAERDCHMFGHDYGNGAAACQGCGRPNPLAETCGVFMSDGLEGSGTGWTCGRPKGHPHDGAQYGKVTAGNHSVKPQVQDPTFDPPF